MSPRGRLLTNVLFISTVEGLEPSRKIRLENLIFDELFEIKFGKKFNFLSALQIKFFFRKSIFVTKILVIYS